MRQRKFDDFRTSQQSKILPLALVPDGVFAVTAEADEERKFTVRKSSTQALDIGP